MCKLQFAETMKRFTSFFKRILAWNQGVFEIVVKNDL